MKITNDDLKKIIKESLKRLRLQEAPFAGVEPGVYIDNNARYDYRKGPGETGGIDNPSVSAIDKFYRTPSYEKKANWAYAGYSIPIYIVPLAGISTLGPYGDDARYEELSREKFKAIVEKSDSTIDLEKVFANLDAGACYIVSSSNYLSRGQLPTPWMIFHAIFDDPSYTEFIEYETGKIDWEGNYGEDFVPGKIHKLYNFVAKLYSKIYKYYAKKYPKQYFHPLKPILSDFLKRSNLKNINEFTSAEDLMAEIMTQELATQSGLQIKPLGNEDDKFWQQILTMIKSANLKKKMENILRGKIVLVNNVMD